MSKSSKCWQQQNCNFLYSNQHANSHSGTGRTFYVCSIRGARLQDENEFVSTNTSSSSKNVQVEMLQYDDNNEVRFIPNSIFLTFPHLEAVFLFHSEQMFSRMKPEYLKNARNLKVFYITEQKQFKSLDGNVFVEAPNLQYINLQNNALEFIDSQAFAGLLSIKGIFLNDNPIVNLHFQTFSRLLTMSVLNILGKDSCIDHNFENISRSSLESQISDNCMYFQYTEDANTTSTTTDYLEADYLEVFTDSSEVVISKELSEMEFKEFRQIEIDNENLLKAFKEVEDKRFKMEERNYIMIIKLLQEHKADTQREADEVAKVVKESVSKLQDTLLTAIRGNDQKNGKTVLDMRGIDFSN